MTPASLHSSLHSSVRSSLRSFVRLTFILSFCLSVSSLVTLPAHAKDYMSAELRKKVEALKADVAKSPTTFDNVRARGLVLFDWMNAYSMTGRVFYEYTTSTLSDSGRFEGTDKQKKKEADLPLMMDKAIKRLSYADGHPKAFGITTINEQGAPYPAASYQTLTVTYTLGEAPMGPGSALVVARHWMPDNMRYQTEDASADDYITVRTEKKGISFERATMNILDEFGSGNIGPKGWVFRIKGGTLKKGDKIIITYGDTAGGARGMKMPTYSNTHMPLPMFAYLAQEKEYFSLPSASFKVGGGKLSGVRGFAPSIVALGEKFEISVRSEDDFYNRPSSPSPAYTLLLDGKPVRKIAASENAITVLKDVSFDKEGVYRLTLSSEDGKINGEVNPIWVQKNPLWHVYWGETHSHSGMAEGIGTGEDLYTFGRDDARLDFLTHSEHDALMDDREWKILTQNVIDFYEPGKFITILGYEYSCQLENGGHHNVFFRTPENRTRVPVQTTPKLADFYVGLQQNNKPEDVLIIPHAHHPGDWRMSEPGMERLVEIMSSHGTFEWFGQYYLANGFNVGFVAGSDDHLSHPGFSSPFVLANGPAVEQTGGLAAVWAQKKTRDDIFDALRARHAYGTTWERIILDMKLNNTSMGERTAFSPKREITGRVIGTGALDTISIIKNGKVIKEFDYATAKDTAKFPAKTMRVAVSFETPSNPAGGGAERVVPRPTRTWKGVISVNGAKLTGASFAGIDNVRTSKLVAVEGNDNARNFSLLTRGNRVTVILMLADVTQGAKVGVTVEPSKAGVVSGPSKQAENFLEMGALDLAASLKDIQKGGKVFNQTVGKEYTDNVVVRRLKDAPVLDATFSFTDSDAFGRGDYYYVRARQIDEGTAWSSPIWVGEKAN